MSTAKGTRRCYDCQNHYREEDMKAIDISREDEYYPDFIYVCWGCIRRVEG